MEDYAAKMAGKTDAELRQYVERHAEYRDDAVLAALGELERRGQPAPEAAKLRPALEAAVRQAAATAPVAAPAPWARTTEAEKDEEAEMPTDAPALYSPMTVAVFSVMSFVIGGVLLLLNMLKLRRYGGAALLMGLVVGAFSLVGWLSGKLPWQYLVLGCNFLMTLVYLYLLWPNFIGSQPYRSRSWIGPFLVVILLNLLFGMLAKQMGLSGLPQ